jgi:hypothetical protein
VTAVRASHGSAWIWISSGCNNSNLELIRPSFVGADALLDYCRLRVRIARCADSIARSQIELEGGRAISGLEAYIPPPSIGKLRLEDLLSEVGRQIPADNQSSLLQGDVAQTPTVHLYYAGDLSLLKRRAVSVVGSSLLAAGDVLEQAGATVLGAVVCGKTIHDLNTKHFGEQEFDLTAELADWNGGSASASPPQTSS